MTGSVEIQVTRPDGSQNTIHVTLLGLGDVVTTSIRCALPPTDEERAGVEEILNAVVTEAYGRSAVVYSESFKHEDEIAVRIRQLLGGGQG